MRHEILACTAFLMFGIHAALCVTGAKASESPARITDVVDVTGRAGALGQRVVNGVVTAGYPAVGALLLFDPVRQSYLLQCSGTLVGCNKFLTAQHCVAEQQDVSQYRVFFQHGPTLGVKAIHRLSDYVAPTAKGSQNDLAIVDLDRSVDGLIPVSPNNIRELFANEIATLVGFGITGDLFQDDAGLKRYGQVSLAACHLQHSSDLVCWNYQGGIPGKNSNTCNGDSGGPLFGTIHSKVVVAGVTSGGVDAQCGIGDHASDASVYPHRAWIADASRQKENTACGELPGLSENDLIRYYGFYGHINQDTTTHIFRFKVSDAKMLRVTMNATGRSPDADFDLYVIKGESSDVSQALCAAKQIGQFEDCEIPAPATGAWTVVVQRRAGQGQFQTTLSVF
jgi:V8-like Glu-specific endopeptidase